MTEYNKKQGLSMDENIFEDRAFFEKLRKTRMPFGRYQGRFLVELPETYVLWLKSKGYPAGELGKMLALVYEIKLNGLEYLFRDKKCL